MICDIMLGTNGWYFTNASTLPRRVFYAANVLLRQSLVLCLYYYVSDVDVLELIGPCRPMLRSFYFVYCPILDRY